MLEMPGLNNTGDVGMDLEKLRRYLTKLIPQLEMELVNAQQDGYQEAYNAMTKGVGAVDSNTTAGALVKHELRKDNPHSVTAEQLGLTLGKLVQMTLTETGMVIRVGEKRGLQINVQEVQVSVNSWTWNGGVYYADHVELGNWTEKIPLLYYTGVTLHGGNDRDFWPGPMNGATSESIGYIRMYHDGEAPQETEIEDNENQYETTDTNEARDIRMTVIGLGVFGYGSNEG